MSGHNRPMAKELAILGRAEAFFEKSVLTLSGPDSKADLMLSGGQFESDLNI